MLCWVEPVPRLMERISSNHGGGDDERGTPATIVQSTPVPAQIMHSNAPRRSIPSFSSCDIWFSFGCHEGITKGGLGEVALYSRFFCELTFDDLQIFLALPSYPGRDPLSSTNLRQRPPQLARAHAPRTGRRGGRPGRARRGVAYCAFGLSSSCERAAPTFKTS